MNAVKSSYHDYRSQLWVLDKKLEQAVKDGSQEEIERLVDSIVHLAQETEIFRRNLTDFKMCGISISEKVWNWARLGFGGGITLLASVVALEAGIATAKEANEDNCTQSEPLLTANVPAASTLVAATFVSGLFIILDTYRTNKINSQDQKLKDALALSSFWMNYTTLKELRNNKDVNESTQGSINTEPSDLKKVDKVVPLSSSVNQKFHECKSSLTLNKSEYIQNNEVLKDRLTCLMIEALPDDDELKQLLIKRQAILEEINDYLNKDKIEIVMKKNVNEIKEAESSSDVRPKTAFLSDQNADRDILQSASSSQSKFDELKDTSSKNLKELDKLLGFSLSKIYIKNKIYSNIEEPSYEYEKQSKDDNVIIDPTREIVMDKVVDI